MADCIIESTTKLCIKCNINMALSDTNFICSDCFVEAKIADGLEQKKRNRWGVYAEGTFNVPAQYLPLEPCNLPPKNKMIFDALYSNCVATFPRVVNLKGDPLSGKTSVAILLLKSLFKADLITCCYYFSMLNTYKYDRKSISTMLSDAEYLCLDNVGCNDEDASLIYSVLNRRMTQQLPTILVYDNGYKPENVYAKTPTNVYIKALILKYGMWTTEYDSCGGKF